MKTKTVAYTLLALSGALCLSTNEIAWQREAMTDCKKEEKSCRDGSQACKKEAEQCKKEAPKTDEASFVDELSPAYQSIFKRFNAGQKMQAMDMADKNKMKPDEAVDKVMKGSNKKK